MCPLSAPPPPPSPPSLWPPPVCPHRNNLMFVGVFSSTTLLSYILFWMIFYNLCHIF